MESFTFLLTMTVLFQYIDYLRLITRENIIQSGIIKSFFYNFRQHITVIDCYSQVTWANQVFFLQSRPFANYLAAGTLTLQ